MKEGEFLGVVGSSGNSTGPHLHFENHDAFGQLIEPWAGPCNFLNIESWWKVQRPYYDSGVLRMTTGDALVDFGVAPAARRESPRRGDVRGRRQHLLHHVLPRSAQHAGEYLHHLPAGRFDLPVSGVTPVPFRTTRRRTGGGTGALSGEPEGTWRFTVAFQSTVTERQFTVETRRRADPCRRLPVQGALLQVQRISSSLRLTWGRRATRKTPTTSSTKARSATSRTTHPSAAPRAAISLRCSSRPRASRFYLVGPRNATREGSLGRFDNGAERPPDLTSCTTRLALQCP